MKMLKLEVEYKYKKKSDKEWEELIVKQNKKKKRYFQTMDEG